MLPLSRRWLLGPGLLLLLCGSSAEAYVRSISARSGVPLHWHRTNCIALRAHIAGSDDIDDGSDLLAVDKAADNWQRAVAHCAYIQFLVRPPADEVVVENDNEVTVSWVEKDWVSGPEYSSLMIALTKVWIIDEPGHPRDAEIQDADIELNGEHNLFSTSGEPGKMDLENTLTHELGHVLGLDHPCYLALQPPDPLPEDHLGQPIGHCQGVTSPEILATTMFPSAEERDTQARTPEADDVAGICALFPTEDDPGFCSADPGDGGCACSAGRGGPAARSGLLTALMLMLALVLMLGWRLGARSVLRGRG
jgi:hypothetical protein